MENVLITGVTGLLGSNLANALSSMKNINVIGVSRDNNAYKHKNVYMGGNVTMCQGDITDYSFLDYVLSRYSIDTVFHLAALSTVQNAELSPLATLEVNAMSTAKLLTACRDKKYFKKAIISSTDKVYGHIKPPFKEDDLFDPKSLYEVSKAFSDTITRMFNYNYGMNCTVFRCCNIFGPNDFNTQRIIPYTILSLLNNEVPSIRVGHTIREYIYVQDVVSILIKLAATEKDLSRINIGSGRFYRTSDLVNTICNKINPNLAPASYASESTEAIDRVVNDYEYLDLSTLKSLLNDLDLSSLLTADFNICLDATIAYYTKYHNDLYNIKG